MPWRRKYCDPLQCSCLDNPMHRGAWRALVQGVTERQTGLRDWTTTRSGRNPPPGISSSVGPHEGPGGSLGAGSLGARRKGDRPHPERRGRPGTRVAPTSSLSREESGLAAEMAPPHPNPPSSLLRETKLSLGKIQSHGLPQ